MRLFGGNRMDRISGMMAKTQIPDDMPIQAGMVSKAIEGAQRQVEAMNFGARKHVLEYDDVMNKQREVIYGERDSILDGKDIHGRVQEQFHDVVEAGVLDLCPEKVYSEDWDWDALDVWLKALTGMSDLLDGKRGNTDNPHELTNEVVDHLLEIYRAKEADLGEDNLRELERQVMLRVIDTRWMEHLLEMDYLKDGIGLRAMGQRDPLIEYKSEAFQMFGGLVAGINEDFLRTIMHVQVVKQPAQSAPTDKVSYSAPSEQSIFGGAAQAAAVSAGPSGPSPQAITAAGASAGGGAVDRTVVKDKEDPYANVGRNDPCPCGSGKKYKKCHGAAE